MDISPFAVLVVALAIIGPVVLFIVKWAFLGFVLSVVLSSIGGKK